MRAASDFQPLRDALFRAAALTESFAPRDLLAQVVPADRAGDILLRGQLLSALKRACTQDGKQWQMRPNTRRAILSNLSGDDALPDTQISSALKGEAEFSADGLEQMVKDPTGEQTLASTVSILEQAGPSAPGFGHLLALSSKLDRTRQDAATDDILKDGFVGRDTEINQLLNALDNPQRESPLRTLHIRGLPGIGKTFLLEHLTQLARERPRIVMIRLDFDRSSLREGMAEAVFDEISRQVGMALPEVATELHQMRSDAAERRTQSATQESGGVPFDLLFHLIDILAQRERQLLFVLDTLEVLDAQGTTFVHHLMSHIDRFAEKNRLDISVISAGRGPIFEQDDPRLLDLILLDKLEREVIEIMLEKRGVPQSLWPRTIQASQGNPLILILVARALQDQGPDAVLGEAEIDVASAGYLYRAILSRVPSDVRKIAALGLILPDLGVPELVGIVGPALNIVMDKTRAAVLFDELASQRWLVRYNSHGNLAHVPEIRREILELTYRDQGPEARVLNTLAAEYFKDRDPVRALYHQLQGARESDEGLPDIAPALAQKLSDDLLEDLTEEAQNAVLRARGGRARAASKMASTAPSRSWVRLSQREAAGQAAGSIWLNDDPNVPGSRVQIQQIEGPAPQADNGLLQDLRNMLDRREWREASHLIKGMDHPICLEDETSGGLLILTHQWRTGHWGMARVLFDLLPETTLDRAIEQDREMTGQVLLEMWAEFRFDDLCGRLQESMIRNAAEYALGLSQRGGFRGGALAFAHLVATDPKRAMEYGGASVVSPYITDALTFGDHELIEQSAVIRRNFGLKYPPEQSDLQALDPVEFARVIAPLNSYAEPIRGLFEDLSENPDSKLFRDMAALGDVLPALGDAFSPGVRNTDEAQTRIGSAPGDAFDAMNALGLSAEFSGGYGFFSPLPDLPLLARSASRWQAATLGQWQFGRSRPERWNEASVNALTLARATALLDGPDPKTEALRQIRLWDDPGAGADADPSGIARRRLAGVYARLSALGSLQARLAALGKTNVSSVLHAPLAVLSKQGVRAEEVF